MKDYPIFKISKSAYDVNDDLFVTLKVVNLFNQNFNHSIELEFRHYITGEKSVPKFAKATQESLGQFQLPINSSFLGDHFYEVQANYFHPVLNIKVEITEQIPVRALSKVKFESLSLQINDQLKGESNELFLNNVAP